MKTGMYDDNVYNHVKIEGSFKCRNCLDIDSIYTWNE